MTTTFENAKVGDRVFDYVNQEWGIIIEVRKHDVYPIVVEYGKIITTYTIGGKLYKENPTQRLFWDEVPPIVAPSKPMEVPPVDTLVRVWYGDDKLGASKFRYSTGKVINGRITCWYGGATSNTTDGDETSWPAWEIVND